MKYKGFTLIEVLIVVIIIGILATLLLPQMGTMAERARTAEAKNMMGALRTLLTAHYMEAAAWPADMATNGAINTALGLTIDTTASLFNYDIEATETGGNILITATRNSRSYATGTAWATITLTISSSGGIVAPGMATTWATTTPADPDA